MCCRVCPDCPTFVDQEQESPKTAIIKLISLISQVGEEVCSMPRYFMLKGMSPVLSARV